MNKSSILFLTFLLFAPLAMLKAHETPKKASNCVLLLANKEKLNLKAQAYFDFFKQLDYVDHALESSFKRAVEVYYEFKKKSLNPKFEKPIAEFSWKEYQEFKPQMDADPRLKDNFFLKELNHYGRGSANDIFQRAINYAIDRSIPSFMAKGLEFNLEPIDEGFCHTSLSYSLQIMHLTFRETSALAGYPNNGAANLTIVERSNKIKASLAIELQARQTNIIRRLQDCDLPSSSSGAH